MPGEFLSRAEVHSVASEQGQVGVPEGVKVGVLRPVRAFHGVGDAHGFEVAARIVRVDEIGSPAELATSGGIDAELLALQASASKADRKRLQAFDIRA
jgi:hypothetical protein